jgi:hypothetical protein
MAKDKGGRPIEFDEQVVKKLEEVFAMDGTVSEACFYAGISRPTYYSHVNEDAPEDSQAKELFNRFQALRERPVLKARQTIIKSLDNPDTAKWYLERKKKNEFAVRTEHTGAEGDKLTSIQVEIVKSNATEPESNTDIS